MMRTLLLSIALGMLSLSANAADDPLKPDDAGKNPAPSKAETKTEEPVSIEVYRIKNADLNDALQAFNTLTSRSKRFGTVRERGVGGKTARGGGGPGGGFPGGGGPGGGFPGGGVPAFDEFGEPLVRSVAGARALADPRTRSLIVRGTEKDQQVAKDVVAILDTPEGKPLPTVKAVQAFRLQHLDANDLANMLLTLDPTMTYRLAPIGRMKLLLAVGTEAQMKEVADAVKKLDIPGETK